MKMCMGTASLGMNYGVKGGKQPPLIEAVRLLEKAVFEFGIDCFDTAAAYGDAESVLGAFFKVHPSCKDTLLIISKLPSEALSGAQAQQYPMIMRQNAERSLSRLGLDRLDGFLFHNAADASAPVKMEALASLKELGLTRSVGVSVYRPDEALIAANNSLIDDIQVPFNVIDHRLIAAGFFEKSNQKRVFARSIFLQGLLLMEQIPRHVSFAQIEIEGFQSIARKYELSYHDACIMFARSVPSIEYLVIGIESPTELAQNAAALEKAFIPEFIQDIKETFHSVDEQILMPNLWPKEE